MEWTIADAARRLDEIADKALHEERQRVQTDDGVVVVISEEELSRIEGKGRSFKQHLLDMPKVDVEFPRDKSPMRDFEW